MSRESSFLTSMKRIWGGRSAKQATRPAAVALAEPLEPRVLLSGDLLGAIDLGGEGVAEIVAYDVASERLFVTNGAEGRIDVLDLSDPANPIVDVDLPSLDLTGLGLANSVAVSTSGIVAVALDHGTDFGEVAFFAASDGSLLATVSVGNTNPDTGLDSSLPDMVIFSPDGTKLLVANEGEPNSDYSIDNEGSVSIIDLGNGSSTAVAALTQAGVTDIYFTDFNGREAELRAKGIRIFGPGATAAQDLEPEYISISPDGTTAFVTLQENNAFAVIDIATGTIEDVLPLGYKDWNKGQPTVESFAFDPDDLPDLEGTTPSSQTVKLGGFSGLDFVGMTEGGNYQFVTIPDRGPNPETFSQDRNGDGIADINRPFALPDYQARIVHFELNPTTGEVLVTDQTFLTRDVEGTATPITGRSNILFDTEGNQVDEFPIDLAGNALAADPFGGDFESITVASDGSYWMVDEYRPAIYHFDAAGVLIDRFVPAGTAAIAGEEAGFYGSETIPAEYGNRRANRGFEAGAIDEENGLFYAFIQTPLANPDRAASDSSDVIRILAIDITTGAPVAEYMMFLEAPDYRESKVDKVGDATYLGDGKFSVIVRDSAVSATGKKYLFEIDLLGASDMLGVDFGDETLEQQTPDDLAAAGFSPVAKRKVANLPSIGYIAGDKVEGVALLPDGRLAILNDNDFALDTVPVYEDPDSDGLFTPVDGGVVFQSNPVQPTLGLISFGSDDAPGSDNLIDVSNEDAGIVRGNWPIFGMYQPDSISSIEIAGAVYYLTANEGDARDYDTFGEETRVKDLLLDPVAFPDAATIQDDAMLGRLRTTTELGDIDGDGDVDQIYAYGARSFSVWDAQGNLVYDSGGLIESIVADLTPELYNAQESDPDEFDQRSDDKGAEPEGLTVGVIDGVPYVFVGLERAGGGVLMFDISEPSSPVFIQYMRNPNDAAPEGVTFIAADDSPNGKPLLILSNEFSGSVSIFNLGESEPTDFDLTIFHNNDGESQLIDAGSGIEDFGGIARYVALLNELRAASDADALLTLSSGDNFLPGPEFNASLETGDLGSRTYYDAIGLTAIGYDAIQLGNHDFDFGPNLLADFIGNVGGDVPYLAANLDFTGEPALQALVDAGRIRGSITIEKGGEMIGIVGAVTPELRSISSPGGVDILDMNADGERDLTDVQLAVQAEIDALTAAGVNKVILISHLQGIGEDQQLIPLLTDVDIAIAGGGDELLANDDDVLIPGDVADAALPYPLVVQNADGVDVPVVTTTGNYKYIGVLNATFDSDGLLTSFDGGPVRVSVTGDDAVTPDATLVTDIVEPVLSSIAALDANVIATSEVALDGVRSRIRTEETNVGNLVADAFLWQAAELAADFGAATPDIAFGNGGGIRNDSVITAGDFTELDTFDILPFSNFISVVEAVEPATLKLLLENAVSNVEGVDGRFAQIAGFTFTYNPDAQAQVLNDAGEVTTEGQRIVNVTLDDGTVIFRNGEVANTARAVNIATVDFIARGGDGYPFGGASFTVLGASYQQALANYVTQELGGNITAAAYPEGGEGRILEGVATTDFVLEKNDKLVFTDADGSEVTIQLKGNGGSITVSLAGEVTDTEVKGSTTTIIGTDVSIAAISLDGTDAKQQIKGKVKGGDDLATILTVTGDGSLKKFDMDDFVVTGSIITEASQAIETIELASLNGAGVTMPGEAGNKGFTFKIDTITDTTINVLDDVKLLTADSIDDLTLNTAGEVSQVKVKDAIDGLSLAVASGYPTIKAGDIVSLSLQVGQTAAAAGIVEAANRSAQSTSTTLFAAAKFGANQASLSSVVDADSQDNQPLFARFLAGGSLSAIDA